MNQKTGDVRKLLMSHEVNRATPALSTELSTDIVGKQKHSFITRD